MTENSKLKEKMVDVKEISHSYDKDYRDGKFGGPSFTHNWILDLLDVKPGKALLDIGCGQGLLVYNAHKRGLKTCGIDISEKAVSIAKKNSPQSEIICADAENLPWADNFFDYITNIGSLEHFLGPENCLKHMLRVLKTDGKACVMLPNIYYYGYLLDKFLKGRNPTSYQTVERFAKRNVWQDLLKKNGFKVERVHKYNKFNKSKLLIWLRGIVIPLDLSHHFVFVCRKA